MMSAADTVVISVLKHTRTSTRAQALMCKHAGHSCTSTDAQAHVHKHMETCKRASAGMCMQAYNAHTRGARNVYSACAHTHACSSMLYAQGVRHMHARGPAAAIRRRPGRTHARALLPCNACTLCAHAQTWDVHDAPCILSVHARGSAAGNSPAEPSRTHACAFALCSAGTRAHARARIIVYSACAHMYTDVQCAGNARA